MYLKVFTHLGLDDTAVVFTGTEAKTQPRPYIWPELFLFYTLNCSDSQIYSVTRLGQLFHSAIFLQNFEDA